MKKLNILLIIATLVATFACNEEDRLRVEQLQQELETMQKNTKEVPDASEATVPEEYPYVFTFDRVGYGVDAGGSVTVRYTLPEASSVEVTVPREWSAVVNRDASEIVITAPDPASPGEFRVTATAADGRTVSAILPVIVRDPYSDATRTFVNALGYYSIKPEWVNLENFRKLADAGLKTVTVETEDYNWKEQMDLAAEVGLRTLPIIGWITSRYERDPYNYKGLDEMIDYLSHHPSTLAYHICDEPSTRDIPSLLFRKEKIESLDPDHPVYINLNPDGSVDALGEYRYRDYIEAYARDCKCKLISFDMYPILPNGVMGDWYKVLTAVSEVSKQYGIPFWAFAASCWIDREHLDRGKPSVETLSLQVYTDLAYGAQVIQYFVILQYGGTDYAPLMTDGTWTPAYDTLKEFNTELHRRGWVFDGCEVDKVRHTNLIPYWSVLLSEADLPHEIASLYTDQDTLVSFITNRGNKFITVANKSLKEKMNVDAVFTDMVYTIARDGIFCEQQPGPAHFLLDEGDMLVIKYR